MEKEGKTEEIGLLICIWKNQFADGKIDYATSVDKQGKRYSIELDSIRGFEDDFEKKIDKNNPLTTSNDYLYFVIDSFVVECCYLNLLIENLY